MTISIRISVNGNYKCPVYAKQGDQEFNQVVSGRDHEGPKEVHIPFRHGPDVLTLHIGPEEPDNGDTELPRGHHAALGMATQDDSGGGGHEKPPE